MRGFMRFTTAIVLVLALAAMAACTPAAQETVMEPKLAPPAIATAGVLVAGVDFEVPPYAGKDDGRKAGMDIDVAAALAEQLGLSLETVQVAPSEAATALADGTADVVFSMPLDEASVLGATIAGTYAASGPAFFVASSEAASGSPAASASVEASDGADPVDSPELLTMGSLGSLRVGAQQDSASFWLLEYELGEGAVEAYPTVRAAFDALAVGQVDVVASDALVGAYIARDFAGVRFAGQPTLATLLGVGAAVENTELADVVRVALDKLAADGVLDAIRVKWVGELPELETIEGALSIDASTTP
ncbi:MAG: transporter substrate-binding domain-containing protein [Coriobacteriia bacterium]|nr:transporter substrate-binding domain-containing protein [Coriobacteriia bacterium]